MNERAMYQLTYGLFILSAAGDGTRASDNACIINTAIQVTSQPNRISIAVNKSNYTHDLVMKNRAFNVSVLSEEATFDLFQRFGFQSGRDVDKFDGFKEWKRSENGLVYVTKGTNAYLSGKVVQTVDLGSHTLFIADVTDMDVLSDVPSATYTYYQNHIKPKPKKAAAGKKTKKVWRCKVCGYIYDGTDLPADYICPVCKHPASDFEQVEVEI